MGTELSDSEIKSHLTPPKKIAVIGLSPTPDRPSYGVARYLIQQGFEIYGVRPAAPPEILGRPSVERLSDLKTPIDIIDVFRSSDAIPGLVDQIEEWMKTLPEGQRPKLLWLQEGVSHAEAEEKAKRLGLKVVSNRCILKEHRRLS